MNTNPNILSTYHSASDKGLEGEVTILVTGACGQLGNEMQLQAKLHPEYRWFFTDIISPEGSDIQVLDICNQVAVTEFVQEHQIDILVNCAAYTAVDKAESETEQANMLNAIAVGFLSLAMEQRRGQMIQISTDYVFDGTAHTPYTEDQPSCPVSVYGRTKLAGEIAMKVNNPSGMIIRTAWLYSRFGNNFVKTMLRLGRERKELGVIFDQIGTPTYARDLVRAIMTAIQHGIVPGTYHFSNEGVCSWYDFTRAIHRLSGITDCNVRPIHTAEYPTPAIRPHYSVLDKTKFKQTYNFDIPYWEDSLRECIGELSL